MPDEEVPVDAPNPFADATTATEEVELLGQGDPEETPAQSPATKDQPKDTQAEGHRSPVQKLIDEKYKGNEEAFLEGLHNQWNSSAELHKTLKEVREELAAIKAGKGKTTEEAPAEEADPDLKSLSDQRALVVQDVAEIEARADELVEAFQKLGRELMRAEIKAEEADEIDKRELTKEVNRIKEQQNALNSAYKRLPREKQRLQVQLNVLDNQIKAAKQSVTTRQKAQEQQKERDGAVQAEFRGTVDRLIEQAVKDSGFPTTGKIAKSMESYVNRSMLATLSRMDPDGPGLDPVEAVKHFSDEYLESIREGQQQTFRTASTTKVSSTTPRNPTAQSPASTQTATRVKASEITPDQIAKHHAAVFGTDARSR